MSSEPDHTAECDATVSNDGIIDTNNQPNVNDGEILRNSIPDDRVIIIIGPTGSGKSKLAIDLALKLNGEIISADSKQVCFI